jgi:aminoglycoside N3'-acetyltransferase
MQALRQILQVGGFAALTRRMNNEILTIFYQVFHAVQARSRVDDVVLNFVARSGYVEKTAHNTDFFKVIAANIHEILHINSKNR